MCGSGSGFISCMKYLVGSCGIIIIISSAGGINSG
jgi:hypothetical protein